MSANKERPCVGSGQVVNGRAGLTAAVALIWHEQLAHDLHAGYLAARRAASAHGATSQALEWSRIAEKCRDANRRAVDHLSVKRAVGGFICRREPPVFSEGLKFEADVLPNLTWAEHNSWSAEKLMLGWQSVPAGFDNDEANGRHRRAFDTCDQYLLMHCDELIAGIDPARYGLPSAKTPTQWARVDEYRPRPGPPGRLVGTSLGVTPDFTRQSVTTPGFWECRGVRSLRLFSAGTRPGPRT